MFSVKKVKDEIQALYRYGMDAAGYSKADVEAMLKTIDFFALTQALRHNSETVYSIFIDGDLPDMLRHRGRELFGERAARIYVDNVLPDAERLEKRVTDGNLVFRRGNGLFEGYSREIWLPERRRQFAKVQLFQQGVRVLFVTAAFMNRAAIKIA